MQTTYWLELSLPDQERKRVAAFFGNSRVLGEAPLIQIDPKTALASFEPFLLHTPLDQLQSLSYAFPDLTLNRPHIWLDAENGEIPLRLNFDPALVLRMGSLGASLGLQSWHDTRADSQIFAERKKVSIEDFVIQPDTRNPEGKANVVLVFGDGSYWTADFHTLNYAHSQMKDEKIFGSGIAWFAAQNAFLVQKLEPAMIHQVVLETMKSGRFSSLFRRLDAEDEQQKNMGISFQLRVARYGKFEAQAPAAIGDLAWQYDEGNWWLDFPLKNRRAKNSELARLLDSLVDDFGKSLLPSGSSLTIKLGGEQYSTLRLDATDLHQVGKLGLSLRIHSRAQKEAMRVLE